MPRLWIRTLCILIGVGGLAAGSPPALAGYGTPIVERGQVLAGVVSRHFTRDVFDEDEDQLSNPSDTFGYTALEVTIGLFRDRFDAAFELGRSHNEQDRFPDRDYLTWDYALGARGLVYAPEDRRYDMIAGISFHESTDFDKSASQTHKLERNFVAHFTVGRRLEWEDRLLRLYGGPIFSSHEFEEYGESMSSITGAAEGETRSNLLILAGASGQIYAGIEACAELEFREDLSWFVTAGYRF
jgi:hypothetical protein